MPNLIFDYADIRSRMLGEDKPTPKCQMVAEDICDLCAGGGWEMYGLGINDPHFRTCPTCGNPEAKPCP